MHSKNKVVTLLFSKDRAAQLDLLLRSMDQNIVGDVEPNINVLYTTTSEDSAAAYEIVKQRFNRKCNFVRESKPLAEHIREFIMDVDYDYIMFMCDDEILYRPLDLGQHLEFMPEALALSLKCGDNLRYCMMAKAPCIIPSTAEQKKTSNGTVVYLWDWTTADQSSLFAYPWSLTAMLYRKEDMQRVVSTANYHSINTLESWLYNVRYGLVSSERDKVLISPEKSVFFSTPYNLVQSDFPGNEVCRKYTLDTKDATEKFLEGWDFYVDYDTDEITQPHQEFPYIWAKCSG